MVAELVLGRHVRLAECTVGTAFQAGAAFVFNGDDVDSIFVGVCERVVGGVVGEAAPELVAEARLALEVHICDGEGEEENGDVEDAD